MMIDFTIQENEARKELNKENRRFRKKQRLSSHIRIPSELLTRLREEAWFKEMKIIDLLEEKLKGAQWVPASEIQKTKRHIVNTVNKTTITGDIIRI